jgi:hypothetical protein
MMSAVGPSSSMPNRPESVACCAGTSTDTLARTDGRDARGATADLIGWHRAQRSSLRVRLTECALVSTIVRRRLFPSQIVAWETGRYRALGRLQLISLSGSVVS